MLVITSQIKAARYLIGWEQYDLASNSGLAISTIRRLESQSGTIGARFETVEKISKAFERAGLEFIGEPNPGVYLKNGAGPARGDKAPVQRKYNSLPVKVRRRPLRRRTVAATEH